MGLLQAGFLAAMAALAVPVVIHLLSRWQVRRLEFGTMRFLQEVIHNSAQRRRIRRWLLLATRMMLVALLALLFARPFRLEQGSREGAPLRLILIDRSASMMMPGRSGRLLDDAVAAGIEAANQAGSDAVVQWAWFDRTVEMMPEGTSRPQSPRITTGGTDYFAALLWARDRLATHSTADAEVVLITDLQQTGLVSGTLSTTDLAFPREIPVRVIDVGRTAANNLAIIALNIPATQLPPDQNLALSATLYNYGALPVEEVPITAAATNGQRSVRLRKSVTLPSEQADEINFDFGRLETGTWQITVDIDINDDLSSDNRRVTAIQVVEPHRVLVIDPGAGDTGLAAASYFLVTALQQGNVLEANREIAADADVEGVRPSHRRFAPEVLYLEQERRSLDNLPHALVVIADAGKLSPLMIQQLEAYARRGGRLLVFAGGQMAQATAEQWAVTGLAPGTLSHRISAAAMPFRIVSIAAEGSMLEPFRDPQHGDLSRLAFTDLYKTDVNDSTQVLAWFDHERPAVTQHVLDSGRIAWFLSSADNTSSNWTTSPLYLPLIQQMSLDLLGLTGEGPIRFRSVGDIADSGLQSQNSVSSHAVASEVMYLDQPGFLAHHDALYVTNCSAKESDPARVSAAAFAEHFDITLASGPGELVMAPVQSHRNQELWPWLAAALVVLLVMEFGLSNRTSA